MGSGRGFLLAVKSHAVRFFLGQSETMDRTPIVYGVKSYFDCERGMKIQEKCLYCPKTNAWAFENSTRTD